MANTEQMEQTEMMEPTEQTETMDLATAQRVEQDKMTRRAALRKFGFGAGTAAFALLGVDDFARMVGKRMERMAGDNKVATQVAREFQQAGIALAGGPELGTNALPAGNCNNFQNHPSPSSCNNCNNDRYNRCIQYCSGAQCASPFNQGTAVCGNASPTYAGLQAAWSGVCKNCLANCN